MARWHFEVSAPQPGPRESRGPRSQLWHWYSWLTSEIPDRTWSILQNRCTHNIRKADFCIVYLEHMSSHMFFWWHEADLESTSHWTQISFCGFWDPEVSSFPITTLRTICDWEKKIVVCKTFKLYKECSNYKYQTGRNLYEMFFHGREWLRVLNVSWLSVS